MRSARYRRWDREAATFVRDTVTARPKEEWPDDEFKKEDSGEAEDGEYQDTLETEREYYRLQGVGMGPDWEPPRVIEMDTPGRDGVPTVDDDLDADIHAAPRSYPSWTNDNSFVVTRTFGEDHDHPTRPSVRKWAKAKYGFIFEETETPGRLHLRVPKPQARTVGSKAKIER